MRHDVVVPERLTSPAEGEVLPGPDMLREHAYQVATALQRLAGVALFGSREAFELALGDLGSRVPDGITRLAEFWIREKLRNECQHAALVFHRAQGCQAAECLLAVSETAARVWNQQHIAARTSLLRWSATLLNSFDRSHPHIGVPVRTGRVLRRWWKHPGHMDDLARRIGTSRTIMDRWFEARYGLTPKAYHLRVRLRAALLLLHESTDKVEYVARRTGFAGVPNFYSHFERVTGMTPSQVRTVESTTVQALLDERLEIRLDRLVNATAQPTAATVNN